MISVVEMLKVEKRKLHENELLYTCHVSTGTRQSTSTPSKENFRNLCFDLLMETYDIS